MKFKLLFCVYFVVCMFYSPIMVFGPISVRHFFTLLMLIICIIENGLKIDKFLKWYFVFLFFCLISALSTGYVESFISKLLGTYLASVVLYLSTKIMIKKYDSQYWVLYIFIAIACLNSIIAIGQFYKVPIITSIPNLLGIWIKEDMLDYYERYEDFSGRYVGGLVGVVNSGYLLSAACVLSLCVKSNKIPILNVVVFALNFYALFLVQQRAGFFIGAFCVMLYYINMVANKKTHAFFLLLFVVIVVICFWGESFSSFNEMRYITYGLETENREVFYAKGMDYFMSHPLGGIYAFRDLGYEDPHNLLVNALLYGGFLGGVIILFYIIKQLMLVGHVMIKTYIFNKYSSILLAFSIAYLCYTLNSLFHNSSLVYGEAVFFLLWGGVVSLYEIENKRKKRIL